MEKESTFNPNDIVEVDMDATMYNLTNIILLNMEDKTNKEMVECLAQILHTSHRNVENWMNGSAVPGLEDICAIARICNVSLDDVVIYKSDLREMKVGFKKYQEEVFSSLQEYSGGDGEDKSRELMSCVLCAEYERVKTTPTLKGFIQCLKSVPEDKLMYLIKRVRTYSPKSNWDLSHLMSQILVHVPESEKQDLQRELFYIRHSCIFYVNDCMKKRKHIECPSPLRKLVGTYLRE